MKKKTTVILIVLAVLVLALAAIRLATREEIPEGALAIHYNEKTSYISLDGLTAQPITGTLINGKGEEKQVEATGVPLKALLEKAKVPTDQISTVSVEAEDAFTAEIAAAELDQEKVFLVQEEGSMKLVVFGDTNSKRQVRNVVSISIR